MKKNQPYWHPYRADYCQMTRDEAAAQIRLFRKPGCYVYRHRVVHDAIEYVMGIRDYHVDTGRIYMARAS